MEYEADTPGAEVVIHSLGTLYQCQSCRYNTFDLGYARGHARSHRVVAEPKPEEVQVEAEVAEATEQEPVQEAPARRR